MESIWHSKESTPEDWLSIIYYSKQTGYISVVWDPRFNITHKEIWEKNCIKWCKESDYFNTYQKLEERNNYLEKYTIEQEKLYLEKLANLNKESELVTQYNKGLEKDLRELEDLAFSEIGTPIHDKILDMIKKYKGK